MRCTALGGYLRLPPPISYVKIALVVCAVLSEIEGQLLMKCLLKGRYIN